MEVRLTEKVQIINNSNFFIEIRKLQNERKAKREKLRAEFLIANPEQANSENCRCPAVSNIQNPICPPSPQCQPCPALSQSGNTSCEMEIQTALQNYKSSQNTSQIAQNNSNINQNNFNTNQNNSQIGQNNFNTNQNNSQMRQNNFNTNQNNSNMNQIPFVNNNFRSGLSTNNMQNNGQIIRTNTNFNNQFSS